MHLNIPITALSPEKHFLLASSKTVPKYYLTLTNYNMEKNFISYTMEIGKMQHNGKECTTRTKRTRYSQLLNLYNNLSKDDNLKFKFKCFPPKKWFNNLSIETAEERLKELKLFVESLTQYPNITQNENFVSFVEN